MAQAHKPLWKLLDVTVPKGGHVTSCKAAALSPEYWSSILAFVAMVVECVASPAVLFHRDLRW